MAEQDMMDEGTGNDIAIIGMAGRFPGAHDLHAFWRNLREGVESISRFQAEELEPSPLVPEALRAHPDFVRAGGVLEGADLFDPGFFDIAPREALWMDPQQRVFLECAWAALEDAAYDPERFPGKISLYAGAGQSGHVLSLLGHVKKEPAALFEALGTTSSENVATKVSFKLKLRGESMTLYTACSTGLVAVHMACQSLLLRQSDIALAGAVRISLPQRTGYLYQDGMIFSPDGHCRAFDARARGTVSGNGVGVVVLKPLADALRDGDHVYAVIKGSAINNDGHQKVGYTAPSVEGQAEAISEALAYAGVGAGDLSYVEAHGTGTPLGDPIEVAALTRAFRQDTDARGFCALGSVKTNIGHLDTAAGIAGLLKATLALHHEELPPSLHFERPNPALDLANSPFFVASERRTWARGEKPRLAGVSSFGIGGTNAHAVLSEAPLSASRPSARPRQLVTLSARTPTALEAMTQELAAHLEAHPGVDLADLAFTRNVGRKAFEQRRALVAADVPSLLARLKAPPAAQALASLEAAREQRVAFLFPGQGAQSVGMARELYASEPGFREHVDACLALLTPRLGRPPRPLLYPAPAQEAEAREALADPRYALPLLFTVEYALARLWMDWGLEPQALFGHSYGEYVAACLAGVLPLEDALALAVVRGQLMARMPPGAMTAAGCSEAELQPLLTGALSLASINGASRCVVSGPVDEVERLEQELARRGVGALRLPARQAFHSADVEPLREELQRTVAGLRLSAPQRPYVSSLTGTWIRPEEATDPSYWARQMRQPVRFAAGLDTLQKEGCAVYLEVGPDQALTTLARMHLRGSEPVRVVPSLPRAGSSASDQGTLLEALGALWQAGLEVRWERFYAHEQRQRLSLPSYPFERQLFRLEPNWVETDVAPARAPVVAPVVARVAAPAPVVAAAGKEAPRTDIERQVMAIWRERLGVEDFGIHDNFLELGGNSLMAAQMLTRLRESFPVQIPLSDLFEAPTVAGVAGRIEARLKEADPSGKGVPVPRSVPGSSVTDPGPRPSEPSLETGAERSRREALVAASSRAEAVSIAALLEAQASRAPESPAVVAGERGLSWSGLRERALRLAGALVRRGVGPEQLVAVCLEPSPERLVAQWAVLEAGGAWVLVPPSRLRELASLAPEGAPVPLLLADSRLRTNVSLEASRVLYVDAPLAEAPALEHRTAPAGSEAMVCLEAPGTAEATRRRAIHTPRTVGHLFHTLDEGDAGIPGGAWLWAEEAAGQGSGLEVLWALCRGLRVVLPREPASARFVVGKDSAPRRPLAFGLSYFANDEDALGRRKYQLLLDGARFADSHGFSAIWTPERHFHSFGGLYPSPAITGAGIATITEHVGIRAGSVVLPLHDPLQVAEEWAMIDNLSGGRVGVSFASGWHANDFVFAPDNYARRKEVMHRGIETVRHLWRGGTVRRRNGDGQEVEISIRPKPVQAELPFWLTAAGSPETFRLAGELGANVLTNLMGQQLDSLAEKVALYRETWRRHGHPGRGHVSLMLHAFLGTDVAEVRRAVREPLMSYFRSSVDISKGFAASQGLKVDASALTSRDMEAMLEHGFERHLEDGGLFGTPESCEPMIERVRRLDVDEVACLVDFGTSLEATMGSLQHLDTLRRRSQPEETAAVSSTLTESGAEVRSLLALVREMGVTHLQCTPSMARALAALPGVSEELRSVRRLFVEGAAPELAASLARAAGVEVLRREEGLGPAVWLPVARRPEGPPAVTRVPRDRALPLSFAQQRLWYLDQLEPGNVAYNNPSALRLSGRLDAAALERALNEVVRRHEVLRTTFALEDSGPVQRIAGSLAVPLPVVRLEAEGDRDEAIARWAREEARRPFALAAGPLIRAALLRVDDTEHVLLVTPHHIVSDGWSAGVMMKELAVLYAAFVSGAPSPLPELPVQYADYSVWQAGWLRGPGLQAELSWLKETLAEVPVLQLPVDFPRPAVQTYRGARHSFSISRPVADALVALSRREGSTLFMVLMAAWQVLLSRYSGQEDFAVGTAAAGRNRPEVEPLVGCFVNSLPLRADVSGEPTFLELLGRVRRTALGAFAHQEAPFEKLVDALRVSRDPSHSPIFQTMLVLHNTPMPTVELAGLTLSGMDLHTGSAKMELSLELRETPEGLWAGLEYNTDLFLPETASQLASHFVLLLEGISAAPERRLSSFPLVSEAERRKLLVEWNPTPSDMSSDTLTALFAAQAARTPEAIALADDTEALSFRELEVRAHRIAHLLRRSGVGAESVVALALERPLDAVAAMLGTLAAGGAWLSLDLSHPRERIRLMLEDADVRVVLTREALRGPLLAGGARAVVCLEQAASEPGTSPGLQPAPHHAAYVLFTSGSTGRPKGVVVEHRHLASATRARFEAYGPPGRCVTLSPFTFDASYRDLFWALFHGGTLHYGAEQGWEDPRVLAATIARHRIEYLFGVPSPYARLLEAAPAGSLGSLRSVFIGGEVCPRELVRAHHEAAPSASFFNEYGPTEVSIWCTLHRAAPTEAGPVPIGRPIPGYRAYILDEHLQPVPSGVPGELYVGGAGVARGYIGRPELTAERFLADPFDARAGARMYRTGDRCRWRRDGEIEFLGRRDGQVKVRGFRVETGEIESVLAAHPEVREGVVLARADERGVMRLIGYVVPQRRPGPDAEVLRSFLRERLPEYMVPFAFVELESLPRARSGKVNPGALPMPERQASVRQQAYVAPRTELEERLARLWSEVLGVERVGVDDNFFELGGDSILSIQVVTRAGRAGIELSPRQVFQNPTVGRLAAVANTRLVARAEQGPVTGPVALSPIQRWFFAQVPTEPHHWNMSLLLEVRAALDAAVLERALGQVVEHHDALRLRFARTDEGWRQVCAAPGEPVRLERVDLSGVPAGSHAAELERRATEAQASLRLDEGPLLRAVLFDLGAGHSGRLLLVLHHLVVDGVSWRILLEDLLVTYQRLAAGAPVALPPKTTSFQAWARGLSEHARSGKLDAERSWWLERPWASVTRLPVDSPGGENTEGSARGVSVSLTAEETRALLQDVPRAYHTQINDALLTALARTVGRWAGNPLVLVDVETHGREELLAGLDVSRTVGWFTTFFPALLEAREAAGPGDVLRDVKEQLRAVPSKGMGYGLLRHLREDAALAGLPSAELSFNYLGQVDGALNGNGMLALAPEGMGPQRGPRTRRPYLLDVVGAVVGGRLQMTWTYGESIHRRETVGKLAADFLERLRELISHCQSPEAGGHTPSDFPMAKVKQSQLDKLSARFGKKTR